ncbi:unnamed protein product [Heligmosomoides polygyrus]|uniref:Histone-lysine N-methyltransferase SETMAR n=1 Tax=Heligmosomoides polygyrus TaxID=6339 RepID=A0A183GJG3_HELPZ|nr:unnamed protein product [Heligmosomoides polygyrus]
MICVGFLRYLSMIGVDRVGVRFCLKGLTRLSCLFHVRESLQSEAVIGVGRKRSEIGERVIAASWSAEVGGQPSKFGESVKESFESDVLIGIGGQHPSLKLSEVVQRNRPGRKNVCFLHDNARPHEHRCLAKIFGKES